MNARLIDLLPELAVAGLIGVGLAAFVLRPVFDRIRSARAWWVQLAAAAAGVALVLPATVAHLRANAVLHGQGADGGGLRRIRGTPDVRDGGARARGRAAAR